MNESKPAAPRVNVKARARLFEQPAAQPPLEDASSSSSSRRGSDERAKRKHAEAALKAKTVQQVLKQVEDPPLSRRESVSSEQKKRHAEAALKAKTVQQVLKQVVSTLTDAQKEEVGGRGRKEISRSPTDAKDDSRRSSDAKEVSRSPADAAEISNPSSVKEISRRFSDAKEVFRRFSDAKDDSRRSSDGTVISRCSSERKGSLNKEEKGKEDGKKDADTKERKSSLNEEDKDMKGEKSKEESKKGLKIKEDKKGAKNVKEESKLGEKRKEDGKKEAKVKDEERNKDEEENKLEKSKLKSDSRSKKRVKSEKKQESQIRPGGALPVEESPSNNSAGTKAATAPKSALSDPPLQENPKIAELLREECQSGDVNLLTNATTDGQSGKPESRSSFWRTLSDSGSSVSSSASDPECAALAKLPFQSPLIPPPPRSFSEPSILLTKLGLGESSRSGTSSPDENNKLEIQDGREAELSWAEGGESKFVSPYYGAGLAAGGTIFSPLSSGADKWRLKSSERQNAISSYYTSKDYELQVKEDTPSLTELINSVQKIQEEFGGPPDEEEEDTRFRRPPKTSWISRTSENEGEKQEEEKVSYLKDAARGLPSAHKKVKSVQFEPDDAVLGGAEEGEGLFMMSGRMEQQRSRLFNNPAKVYKKYDANKPLSPTSKVQVTPKPDLPSYLTLSGRRGINKVSDNKRDAYSDNERAEFEKIDSILSELDFSKYRRGRSNTLSPATTRSLSESPRPGTRQPFRSPFAKQQQFQVTPRLQVPPHTYRKFTSVEEKNIPTTPKVNRLKELTEKLKPSSLQPANDVRIQQPDGRIQKPANQILLQQQLHNQQLQLQLMQQHQQLQQLQQQHLEQLQRLQEEQQRASGLEESSSTTLKAPYYVSGSLTLPHKVMEDKSAKPPNPKIEISDNNSNPSDSATDEGFVAEPSSSTALQYHNVIRRQKVNSDAEDAVPPNSPDKRGKRRKNANNGSGFQIGGAPLGNRSMTYPPQRKGSISEEMDFTSVDSNGLRSFGGAEEPRRQLSDVSLADSHFSPSEGNACETYLDVMERVTQEPNEVDERGKGAKKKHYSDPSGEKNEGLLDLPEFIVTAKSDPQLGSKSSQIGKSGRKFPIEDRVEDQGVPQTSKPGLRMSHLAPVTLVCSDMEGAEKGSMKSPQQQQRRYFKKRLRGPYGEMLEEEMRKSGEKQMQSKMGDMSFLQDILDAKSSGNYLLGILRNS